MDAPFGHTPRQRGWMPKALKVVLITLIVLASPLLLLQLSYVAGTAKMRAIADQMHPAPGWVPDGENVSGGIFCIGIAVPCDSMWRQYRAHQPVTPADVHRISVEAGLDGKVDGDCETSPLPPNVTSLYEACSAKGVIDGYDVEVRVLKHAEDDPEGIIQLRLSSIRNR